MDPNQPDPSGRPTPAAPPAAAPLPGRTFAPGAHGTVASVSPARRRSPVVGALLVSGLGVVILIVGTLLSEVLAKNWEPFRTDYGDPLFVWFLHDLAPMGTSGLIDGVGLVGEERLPALLAGVVVFFAVSFGVVALGLSVARSRLAVLTSTWLGVTLGAGFAALVSGVVTVVLAESGYPAQFGKAAFIRLRVSEGHYWGLLVGLALGLLLMVLWRPRDTVPAGSLRAAPGAALFRAGLVALIAAAVMVASTLAGEWVDANSASFGSEGGNPLFVFVLNPLVPLGLTGVVSDSGWLPGFLGGFVVFALVILALMWPGLRHHVTGLSLVLHTWLSVVLAGGLGAATVGLLRIVEAQMEGRELFASSMVIRGGLVSGLYWGSLAGIVIGLVALLVAGRRASTPQPQPFGSSTGPRAAGTSGADWDNDVPR